MLDSQTSSYTLSGDTRRAAPSDPLWNDTDFYPEVPLAMQEHYGYTANKDPHPCTLEQLRSQVAWDRSKSIKLVWTPESLRMMPPEEAPVLLHDVRHRDVLYARGQLRLYLLTTVAWTVFALFNFVSSSSRTNTSIINFLFLPLVLGFIPALQAAWALHQMRTHDITIKDALDTGQQLRFQDWLGRHRARLTLCLMAALVLIFLVQAYTSIQHLFDTIFNARSQGTWSATDAAGLVKSAVRNGEVWRLITGPLLHASIWHILFNVLALYAFGKITEVLIGWVYVPIVFFFSAITGSLFSLLLLPTTSVGASGGIMGIVGFLLVFGYYKRANLPPNFFKSMVSTIFFVALFGVVAFAIIDNAAHIGGALCGVLLGYALLPHQPVSISSFAPSRFLKALAAFCIVCLLGGVVISLAAMFTWR